MNEAVGSVSNRGVPIYIRGGAHAPSDAAHVEVLPAPSVEDGAANGDVMALLYGLTAKQRDTDSAQRAGAAKRTAAERQHAFEQMREEIQKAKDAQDDGGWLGLVTHVLDVVADVVVGGNPLQDLAHDLSEWTGIKAFDVAYDFMRPDALLHGAVVLTGTATDCKEIAQVYDVGAVNSSLKTRFQAAADLTGRSEVMDAYAVTRDSIAAAAITVGTCGVGTVAVVAIAVSAALMLEAKADLLGTIGVADEAKMWVRLGAQGASVVATGGASLAAGGKMAPGGVRAATNILNGANQVARGSVQFGQAIYEHASTEHLAESATYQNIQHQADREQQRLVRGLREISKSYERSLETIARAMNERDQLPLILARRIA